MKSFIDNKLLRALTANDIEEKSRHFLEVCSRAGIHTAAQPLQITFGWPSLLECIGESAIFHEFPKFDEQSPLFAHLISAIITESEKDLIVRLYDQVFVECLTHVKALSHIHPTFLLSEIQEKRQLSLFSQALDSYEKLLVENPRHALHDLTLYLAWDRVCVNVASVFDHNSPELKNKNALDVLQECLLESFQHITEQGRTSPGSFRLAEALYAYYMREEKLQSYTDADWLTLCQSARALVPREELCDVPYVDYAKELVRVFTMDPVEKVKAGRSLAQFMIEKLKLEIPGCGHTLAPVEIVYLKEGESGLYMDLITQL